MTDVATRSGSDGDRIWEQVFARIEALLTVDDEGVVQGWNDGSCELFGLSASETIGRPLADLGGDVWRDHSHQLLSRVGEAATPLTAEVFWGWNGTSPLYVSLIASLIDGEDGQPVIAIGARDVTDRRQSEQFMLASMRSAPTAMVMVDAEGRIVLANTGAEHLFGHKAEDLLGGPVEVLVPERFRGDHPGSRAGYRDEPGTRPMGAGRDLYGLRADGTEVPIEIGLNPVETDEGLFVLSAIADITERKHLHEEQQRLNDELTAANEALMQSNIDLQQFAHVASHDLQAPLRHIAGFVQLLRDEYLHQLDERADQWIARTLEGVGRMQTMIRELLAYSRVDPRARPFKPVALGRAVDDALELLASSVADSGAEITCDDLPVVIGDGAQIAQLFQNLLSNSIKYHGDNQPRIGIWAESSSTEWIVSVKDNGIGIDREHHDKIFDVFHRLHSEREYPGTGIGLSVCRRIVQRHGGRIWIDPETAEGTVVRFALPLPATG